MKKILFLLGFLSLFIHQNVFGAEIDNLFLKIKGENVKGINIYKKFDKILSEKSGNDLEIKKSKYLELLKQLDGLDSKKQKKLEKIKKIFNYGLSKTETDIKNNYEKIQEIVLGYSTLGKPIKAYYKGNPNKGFFGIFSNIHGGYEYGTYYSALFLLEELEKSGKNGWFIIPTINPDGLNIAEKDFFLEKYYLIGRANANLVDLNRNFCTKGFKLKTYKKYSPNIEEFIDLNTGIKKCNSEKETKIITETINKYKFNKIISLHSQWNLFFIPSNSFDDEKVINFGKQLHEQLPKYKFDISYKDKKEQVKKKEFYEINGENSGTMETYIYEAINIPVILIELAKHGEVDKDLKNIINLID